MPAEVIGLFPIPIYSNKLNYTLTTQEVDYIKSVKNSFYQENGTVQDGNNYVLDKVFSKELKTLLQNELDIYTKEVFRYSCDVYITHSWLNVNPQNTSHNIHNHVNSVFSGVFYIEVPDDSPGLTFINDRKPMFEITPTTFNDFNSKGCVMGVKQGTVVIFPSEMNHQVSNNKSTSDRISLAFNSFVRGSIGDLDKSNYIEMK